jgi:small-conductance mechanosensitive channel
MNTLEYILNYSFAIKDHEFSVGWILFVISTLLITYLVSNLVAFYLDFYSNAYTKKNYGYKVLIKISLYFIGFYIILILSGFQIDKFTLVLSALGFGIGFGLQSIAGNITSGLMLMFEKNLKIDDKIEINGKKGLIKDIGGRSIRIYCEDGSDILIPSSDFFDQTVINWNLGDSKRRIEINLSFKTDTNISILKETINNVLEKDEAINQRNKTDIHILSIDNKGIHIGVYFWFDNVQDENAKISNLLENIKLAIEEKGIQFYTDK